MSTRDRGILASVLPWPLQPLSACPRRQDLTAHRPSFRAGQGLLWGALGPVGRGDSQVRLEVPPWGTGGS